MNNDDETTENSPSNVGHHFFLLLKTFGLKIVYANRSRIMYRHSIYKSARWLMVSGLIAMKNRYLALLKISISTLVALISNASRKCFFFFYRLSVHTVARQERKQILEDEKKKTEKNTQLKSNRNTFQIYKDENNTLIFFLSKKEKLDFIMSVSNHFVLFFYVKLKRFEKSLFFSKRKA